MTARLFVVLVVLAVVVFSASADIGERPLEARVRALEDRLARVERRLDDLQVQLAAVLKRLQQAVPEEGFADVRATVDRVIDGATFRLASGQTVRLIGVDPSGADREAAAHVRALVEGKTVRLEFDALRRDAQDRLLAYVYVGRRFVNAELLRHGYAKAVTTPLNIKHAAEFLRLQRAAQAANRGLWAKPAKP